MMDRRQEEYGVVRNSVGLFDFSDSTKIMVSGDDAVRFLDKLTGGNIELLREGQVTNTLFMNNDGTILAIVWILRDEDHLIITSEAEKRKNLFEWLSRNSEGYEVRIEDKSDDLGCLAVIGPMAQEVVREVADDGIIGLQYLGFEHNQTIDCIICRVGYTGEYEYRFILPKKRCKEVAEKIKEAGKEYDLVRCESDVLDILMLEMKSVNQNKDILDDTTPIQAGLPWMIDFRKDDFIGRDSVLKETKSPRKTLLTLLFDDVADIQNKAKLYIEDQEVGMIVHKDFSPTLEKDIGLAYIDDRFGCVGIGFEVKTVQGDIKRAKTVSSPLFITKTVQESAQ